MAKIMAVAYEIVRYNGSSLRKFGNFRIFYCGCNFYTLRDGKAAREHYKNALTEFEKLGAKPFMEKTKAAVDFLD